MNPSPAEHNAQSQSAPDSGTANRLAYITVIRVAASPELGQSADCSYRSVLRAAVEASDRKPFTVYVLPMGATLTMQATLRDELIRSNAAAPWEVLRTSTVDQGDDDFRAHVAPAWPHPQDCATKSEHLIQIGSVVPLGKYDAQPHEVLFAGTGMESVVAQLDRVRTDMRRLLWVFDKDIGERRRDVLADFAALVNARIATAPWADDQPAPAFAYLNGAPPKGRNNGKLFGVWITEAEAKWPWGTLRDKVFTALHSRLHQTLQEGKFTNVAATRALPRVLILGESGAGKSLAVDYLARRVSDPGLRRLQRVSVPDYVGAEASLKHELFGYMPGSFTGAAERGDPGLLLSNIGGVIFLDEIGDASPELQAKLLAYLDDFCVRPVGYNDTPLPCPTLVVAATNRPIEQWAQSHREGRIDPGQSGNFRHDLLERFDTVVRLPSLNQRIKQGELPAIVDALLQTEAVNPIMDTAAGTRRVAAIDGDALANLAQRDYEGANLRKLTRLLSHAVQRAQACDRTYLTSGDVPFEVTSAHASA